MRNLKESDISLYGSHDILEAQKGQFHLEVA